jgi:hypothetical protein
VCFKGMYINIYVRIYFSYILYVTDIKILSFTVTYNEILMGL